MSSKWPHRIRLYLTGVVIGSIICYFTLWKGKDVGGFLPGPRVKAFIANSKKLNADSSLQCRMKCDGYSVDDIRKAVMGGEVDFSKSQTHKEPCHEYDVTMTVKGKPLEIYFSTCTQDSVAAILRITPSPGSGNCNCK